MTKKDKEEEIKSLKKELEEFILINSVFVGHVKASRALLMMAIKEIPEGNLKTEIVRFLKGENLQ